MRELSADNVIDYLREKGWIGPSPARAEELSGGVSNCVLRVSVAALPHPPGPLLPHPPGPPLPRGEGGGDGRGGCLLIVKQSRPRLRTSQAWFSDVSRIHREEDAQRLLAEALPGNVPRVLFSAREDYVYAMEHAHPDARPWKQLLLRGVLDAGVARDAGRLLRGIHSVEVKERGKFLDREAFRQLRVDPFYRQVQAVHPDLAPAIRPLIEAMETRALGLCHGDFSPKNLLVSPGLMLVDHETAHLGEPAMDVGFFASHLLLKAVRSPELADGFVGLVREALAGYGDEAVVRRALGHLGACLLARVDGTSPVDYLPEEGQKQMARRLGRMILLGGLASWDEALEAARAGHT